MEQSGGKTRNVFLLLAIITSILVNIRATHTTNKQAKGVPSLESFIDEAEDPSLPGVNIPEEDITSRKYALHEDFDSISRDTSKKQDDLHQTSFFFRAKSKKDTCPRLYETLVKQTAETLHRFLERHPNYHLLKKLGKECKTNDRITEHNCDKCCNVTASTNTSSANTTRIAHNKCKDCICATTNSTVNAGDGDGEHFFAKDREEKKEGIIGISHSKNCHHLLLYCLVNSFINSFVTVFSLVIRGQGVIQGIMAFLGTHPPCPLWGPKL